MLIVVSVVQRGGKVGRIRIDRDHIEAFRVPQFEPCTIVAPIQQFGFTNTTWGGGPTGSGVPELSLFGLDLGPNAGFRGQDTFTYTATDALGATSAAATVTINVSATLSIPTNITAVLRPMRV